MSHLREQARKRSGNAANKDRKSLIALWHWGMKYIDRFPLYNPFMIDRFLETKIPYGARSKWLPRLGVEAANIKSFGIHAIRHLSASILSKNNVPLIDIQTILGHKNLSTTEKYIHRLESVRSALRHFEQKAPLLSPYKQKRT